MTRMYLGKRPDWVMLGVPQKDDGVAVLASTKLTRAELEEKFDAFYDDWTMGFMHIDPRRFTVSVEMTTFIVVFAPDYATALAELLGEWKPERTEQIGIGA